ncbi:DoxX family membrane protein [Prauserella muralis]|uniref:DoxX family protein n=1 Tax=Prauserella muralis TaxID=588067 RepID=A0A2V4AQ31_9PSEU|nr:DoxX family membrane protein [Prauserella muralis]PXY22598.1 DoxX family protein [Prauserella muralis]TWE28300.1 DoxX-like protein [Prauserella muralis]
MTIQRSLPRPSVLTSVTSVLTGWLARNSIGVLRVSLGVVFLAFGVPKFFPGVSPAQELAVRTLETLSFGVLSGGTALLVTALAECFIGLTLISGRLLKAGLLVLAVSLAGIMSPLVLFFTELFPGAPTLEAQYVVKDIVLAAAGLVVAAKALGARLVPGPAADARADRA